MSDEQIPTPQFIERLPDWLEPIVYIPLFAAAVVAILAATIACTVAVGIGVGRGYETLTSPVRRERLLARLQPRKRKVRQFQKRYKAASDYRQMVEREIFRTDPGHPNRAILEMRLAEAQALERALKEELAHQKMKELERRRKRLFRDES